jgi:hypothetical protein
MNTVLDQWKTATTGDDGNAYYIPENGIRAALTARGLIGGWGYYDAALASTFPAERSGRFTYNDPSTDKAGDNLTIDQIWTYLNHAQAPNSGLQADAKWIWQLQLQKLDRSYSILLNSLAQTYRSAGSVLIPLRTATLHALDSNATPGAGTDTPALGGDPSLAGLGGGADVPGLGGDSSLAGLGGGADPSSLLADPGSLSSLASIPDTSSLAVDPSSLPGLSPVPDVSNLAAVPGPTDPGASLAGFANPGTSGGLPQLSTGADWNNALSNLPGGSGAGLGYTGIPGLGTLGGLSSLDSLGKNGGAAGLAEAAGGPNGGAGAALAGESASPFGSAGGAAASGEGGIPLYPPTGGMGAGAGGADGAQERERHTWITEDEAVWGADPDLPPAVLGRN